MDTLITQVIAWPTLVTCLLMFGFAPGAVLRVIVLAFRRDDPRRTELLGELPNVPRVERPFWVCEQLEVALFEGLAGRLAALMRRVRDGRRRSLPDQSPEKIVMSYRDHVKLINGPSLASVLARAREEATHWAYRGPTGTYMRLVTLPECVAQARDATPRRPLEVRLEILDPLDVSACERYLQHHAMMTGSQVYMPGDAWTLMGVQRELFATVLAAGWHKRLYSLLNITVALTAVVPTFRYDLSDSCVIITQGNPRDPVMVVYKDAPHYRTYVTEIENGQQRAKPLAIDGPHLRLTDPLTVAAVRYFFLEAGLPLPDSFTEEDVQQIIEKAFDKPDPYPAR